MSVSAPNYKLWVSGDRTVLLRVWQDGSVEIALRPSEQHTWGPPILLHEERES